MSFIKYMRALTVAMVFYLVQSSVVQAYTVELAQDEVQEAVSSYFPIKHVTPFMMLTVYSPKVLLEQNSNRIALAFSVLANVPGILTGEGRGTIEGDLEYHSKRGEFYLRDPKIRNIEIYDLPAELTQSIQLGLQQLMKQSLSVILVYKLQDKDLQQMMAKSVLSSVEVRRGKVILELSVPVLGLAE